MRADTPRQRAAQAAPGGSGTRLPSLTDGAAWLLKINMTTRRHVLRRACDYEEGRSGGSRVRIGKDDKTGLPRADSGYQRFV